MVVEMCSSFRMGREDKGENGDGCVCVCVSHEIYLSVNLCCVCSLKEPGEIASSRCVSGREVH